MDKIQVLLKSGRVISVSCTATTVTVVSADKIPHNYSWEMFNTKVLPKL